MIKSLTHGYHLQAASARLDRLENDQDAGEVLGQHSDDEFCIDDSDEGQPAASCKFEASG